MVIDKSVTGRPAVIAPDVARSLSNHTRVNAVGRYKIGITCRPEQRFREYGREFDEMVLLYCSTSRDYVRDLEAMLVEMHWEWCENMIGGGGGSRGSGRHYLYVVRERLSWN